MTKQAKKQTFGVIVTTRSFFPSHLAKSAREAIAGLLDRLGYGAVMVGERDTGHGAVMTLGEAKTCAELFRRRRDEISGIIAVLPNFGEELGVAEAIDRAGLGVPILVQACDDDFDRLDMGNRRDAFCGKISLCNSLYQRGIPFTGTTLHTCALDSAEFEKDVRDFAAVCNVANGLRGARIAMLGARPAAFGTVRFSEKILQRHGISVQTVDLSEVIAAARRMGGDGDGNSCGDCGDGDGNSCGGGERGNDGSNCDGSNSGGNCGGGDTAAIKAKCDEIRAYGRIAESVGPEKIALQARLCLAMEQFVDSLDCQASSVQCWDSLENNYGCAACLGMSMMGERGKPSACEADVAGALSMLAAQLAAGSPPALMDWNNNARGDRDACIALHCSNFPKSFFQAGDMEIGCLDVLGGELGEDRSFGACKAQVAAGPMTYLRITTDDARGVMKMYTGEGEFVSEPVPTKGGVANCRVPGLQKLMKHICGNGFEHHVCFVRGRWASVLEEALGKYMGVEVYNHKHNERGGCRDETG
ncbi:MAG: fucose isomerase [Clostridiales bacterium]|jgi:L-fucose isomerase-like protein|nr:fucose isomerase [Clostridiales bacterium]